MKQLNHITLDFLIAFILAAAARGDGFVPTTGGMNYPRYNHTATRLLDGRVLVVAGHSLDYGILASAELYNPATGAWTNTASLYDGGARELHTATLLLNGKVLVAGGVFQGAYGQLFPSSQLYDPTNGTWSGALYGGFYAHTATLLPNGKVLIAGGEGDFGRLSYAELYDPAVNSSSYTESLRACLKNRGDIISRKTTGMLDKSILKDR